jgi:superfamily II DNA/RNA helicase
LQWATFISAQHLHCDWAAPLLCPTQVIIGTHGRMKNWVSKRQLEIDNINILVFDEADEMLKADAFADDTGNALLLSGIRVL